MSDMREIFILGAGASSCMGLPLWDELKQLILDKLSDKEVINDLAEVYPNDTISRAKSWVEEIGKGKGQPRTLDECLFLKMSKGSNEDFEKSYDLLFEIIEQIFKEKLNEQKKNDHFISILINIFLGNYYMQNGGLKFFLENKIFIDFNYDDVLSRLLKKEIDDTIEDETSGHSIRETAKTGKTIDQNKDMNEINSTIAHTKNLFKPHGCFNRDQAFLYSSETYKDFMPKKEVHYNQCISCYDAEEGQLCFAAIDQALTNRIYTNLDGITKKSKGVNLYILGVGPDSISYNVKKINFSKDIPINKIVYTCYDEDQKNKYEEFLVEKFGKDVKLECIKACEDLKDVYTLSNSNEI